MRAIALNCTLKLSPQPSSTELIASQVLDALETHGVERGPIHRLVDRTMLPGVQRDQGGDDEWPEILREVLAAEIVVFATPTWMGHASSVAHRALERLDAELGETDAEGRPSLADKVAIVAVVGNEDGAHEVFASVAQALNDVGFTLPMQANTYWNGEAMGHVDYRELDTTPESTADATRAAARNAAHLARVLQVHPYPAGE